MVRPHQWSKKISERFQISSGIRSRAFPAFTASAIVALALLTGCAQAPIAAPVVNTAPAEPTVVSEPAGGAPSPGPAANTAEPAAVGGQLPEIIVYASDVPADALRELDFMDDVAAPGGKMISLPNNGDELDPPPENDPNFTFNVQVQSGVPYRCWVHLKVGEAKGRSTANVVWVQFSDSVNQANQEVFRTGTNSFLTAQGPTQLGWTWVGCDAAGSDSLVYFPNSGQVTVRIQAGAEGVGFDQFVLSPAKYLSAPPAESVVGK
jgi:hypothetical protein